MMIHLRIVGLSFILLSQITFAQYSFEPSSAHPFGQPNPEAPKEILDYAPLIGTSNCKSIARKPDQTWGDTIHMQWTFKYIMNGTAVQDMTLKEDGGHSGSIRQFIADSSKWYVHYYSNRLPTTPLSTWEGGKRGDSIVLYKDQKAPNGMDGFFRITFNNISKKGFNWLGEWVDSAQKIQFPTWKIYCTKED